MSDERQLPNYEVLSLLCEGSDSQIDQVLVEMISKLLPSAVEQLGNVVEPGEEEVARVRVGLQKALDFAAHGALASEFVMRVLDMEWRRLGGSEDDPAPWRKDPPWGDGR